MNETLSSELGTALFSAVGSAVALLIGRKRGFFQVPRGFAKADQPPTFLWVFFAFALYFAVGIILPLLLNNFLSGYTTYASRVARISWAAFLLSLCITLVLGVLVASLPKPMRESLLLKRKSFQPANDLLLALCGWLISFPLVVLLSSLLEILLYLITGTLVLPDQVAVLFLKMTFGQPFYFLLATIAIVIFAPLIEETLFRGFLQNYLRRYLSPFASVAAASICFTSFHFSMDQGISNIPILSSLFILGCFLGFLYERQQSIFSPILMHALFNALSVANLYFLDKT